jgi:hypothetical protein
LRPSQEILRLLTEDNVRLQNGARAAGRKM